MRFSKDVNAAVSRPVPFNHLTAKIRDIAKVENIVILLKSCSLHGTGMHWRLVIWLFWWWQALKYLLRCLETINAHRPDLSDLARQAWRQIWQMCWHLAIICYPHEVVVDEDGKIVFFLMGLSSMANEHCWHKLSGRACKSIK